jgi:SAM-dependent methyltransferase
VTAVQPHPVEWTPEKVGRIWDFFSEAAAADSYFSFHSGAAIVARADELVGLRGKRILDFGCGRGDLLAHLFQHGLGARGLEFSPDSATQVSARFAGDPRFGGVELVEELPSSLPDGAFDVVFLVEVIEHLLDDQIPATLTEIERLLAPGGVVVVTCPNDEQLAESMVCCPDCGGVFHRWQHLRSLSTASIAELFARHGFAPVHVETRTWGAGLRPRMRARVRRLVGRPRPAPHLLYIGTPARREGAGTGG